MENIKLIKASAIVDFYISKKKYNSFKKDISKRRYVEQTLNDYFSSLENTVKNGCEIRYCRISSNSFWGQEITIINDLGYSYNNLKEFRPDDKLPIRLFGVDIIGIYIDESINKFDNINDENFIISFNSILTI